MTWEPRPVPEVTPETKPYWVGASEGKLVLPECQACGLVYYYPRALCPDCFGDDVEWIEASGEGRVYTYGVSNRVSGWPDADLPLINALVTLAEGPIMETLIVDADPEDVEIDAPVRVTFRETEDDDVAIPVFELAE